MKKILTFITFISVVCFYSTAFSQTQPLEFNKATTPNKEINHPQHHNQFKPHCKMPRQVKTSLDFFKFADELELTDNQLIQLRAYYKKHFAKQEKKLEKPEIPSPEKFVNMTESEMTKFAEEESKKVQEKIMSVFQKIIDLKKILNPEQIQKLHNLSKEEAKKNKNKKQERISEKSSFFRTIFNILKNYNYQNLDQNRKHKFQPQMMPNHPGFCFPPMFFMQKPNNGFPFMHQPMNAPMFPMMPNMHYQYMAPQFQPNFTPMMHNFNHCNPMLTPYGMAPMNFFNPAFGNHKANKKSKNSSKRFFNKDLSCQNKNQNDIITTDESSKINSKNTNLK